MRREERKREKAVVDTGRAIAAANSRLVAFAFRRQVRKQRDGKEKTW
jgi:hypothetical protein